MRSASEISAEIRSMDTWNRDLLAELCEAAGMSKEWAESDGDSFETVVFAAAKKLGVEIL